VCIKKYHSLLPYTSRLQCDGLVSFQQLAIMLLDKFSCTFLTDCTR